MQYLSGRCFRVLGSSRRRVHRCAGELGAAEALGLTYSDTISDLALSTTGGLIGTLAATALFGVPRTASGTSPSNKAISEDKERQHNGHTP